VTWTLDALLPATSSRSVAALLRGKAGVSQLLLCPLPKQSTWHQQMQHDSHHERSKHIGLRHRFLRERVEDNTISLSHVPSADNIADLLVKYRRNA